MLYHHHENLGTGRHAIDLDDHEGLDRNVVFEAHPAKRWLIPSGPESRKPKLPVLTGACPMLTIRRAGPSADLSQVYTSAA